jgi:hypothetical protein
MFSPLATFAESLLASWVADAYGPTSMIGLSLAIISIAALVVYWHLQQRKAKKAGMAALPFIIACIIVALLAVAAASYGIGLRTTALQADSTQPESSANPRPAIDNSSSGTADIGGATINGTLPPGFLKNEGTFSGRNMTVNAPNATQNKPLLFFSWTAETLALSPAELISRLNVVAKELRDRNKPQDWAPLALRGRDLVGGALNKGIKIENAALGAYSISYVHIPDKEAAKAGADFLDTIATALAEKK